MWELVVTLVWMGRGYAPDGYHTDDMLRGVKEQHYTFPTERACRAMGRRLATDPVYRRNLEPDTLVITIQDCRRRETAAAPPPPR